MGSRAVITTKENFLNKGIGIYVHYKGDPWSVQNWLDICKNKCYRKPEDDCYGWAYLCREIANYFGDGLSVGIDTVNHLDTDNWGYGTYFIEDWKIVGGMYNKEEEMTKFFKQKSEERGENV